MKILSILGTRPEAIKMAPVIQSLTSDPRFNSFVCTTGQHRHMLDLALKQFDIIPDYDFNIMSDNQNLTTITTKVLNHLQPYLQQTKPDLILVQGDTTTCMAASLSAYYAKIPVAHIEAGIRTNNVSAPFPEEMNRQLVSRLAEIHFAPTQIAKNNLLKEGIDQTKISLTGNTVIDALFWMRDHKLDQLDIIQEFGALGQQLLSDRPMVLFTCHRRESFGAVFSGILKALRSLAVSHPDWIFVYPVHMNPNIKELAHENLSDLDNFMLLPPVNYAAFVYLMQRSKIIITDSGGIQEEAPALGKPVLLIREITGRPEGIDVGSVSLIGTTPEKIISATNQLMQDNDLYQTMSAIRLPFGDGQATKRIINFLVEHYDELIN